MTQFSSSSHIRLMQPTENIVQISVVIPVYRGARFLPELVKALAQVREEWQAESVPFALCEAIFVDDASVDKSYDILMELQKQHRWIRVLQLSRNFGQHPATVAGILHTSGDWVCTLDEDLQHPPECIHHLLEYAIEHSLDVAYAKPMDPVHESSYRDLGSKLFKSLNRRLTGNPHVRRFNSFRMIRGNVARAAAAVSSAETYYDIALCWFTNRIGRFPLVLKDRRFIEQNQSGYNFFGLMRHARRMLVSSKINGPGLSMAIGVSSMLGSVLLGLMMLGGKLLFPDRIAIQGWTTLYFILMFFGGLSSVMLGVSLEYILIILMKIQGQPTYLVIDRSLDQPLKNWLASRRVA